MKPVVASTVASTAYLLISHGSRDPRPQVAMDRLSDLVRQRLEASLSAENDSPYILASSQAISAFSDTDTFANTFANPAQATQAATQSKRAAKRAGTSLVAKSRPSSRQPNSRQPRSQAQVIVNTACLELAALTLSEQIYQFGCYLAEAGIKELKLLPVFLMAGVHVMEDIPAQIEAARQRLAGAIQLTICPHLGSHARISEVLAKRLAAMPTEGSLLVAHGSRRRKGNRAIQALAKQLDTAVAYWAIPPDIETQVIELMQQGCQGLTILPYFLFAGGITDAIAHRTEELAERFPKVKFRLLPTLGSTEAVADLAVDLISESRP